MPTSVQAQYLTAMKYSGKPRVEALVKDGLNHPDTDNNKNDNDTNEQMVAWIHRSHLSDNKLLNGTLNKTRVYLKQDKDWLITDYNEERLTTIDGKEYLNQTAKSYYDNNNSANTDNIMKIPKTKDGKEYSIESMARAKRCGLGCSKQHCEVSAE